MTDSQTPLTDTALRYVDDRGQDQTYGQLTRVTAVSRRLERDRADLIAALETVLVAVADRFACPESSVALRKQVEGCGNARATLARMQPRLIQSDADGID